MRCTILLSLVVVSAFVEISNGQTCSRLGSTRLLKVRCTNGFRRRSVCTSSCASGYTLSRPVAAKTTCMCTSSGCNWSAGRTFCRKGVATVKPTAAARPTTPPRTRAKGTVTTAKAPVKTTTARRNAVAPSGKTCSRLAVTRLLKNTCTDANQEDSICTFRCTNGYQLVRSEKSKTTCKCTGSRCVWTVPKNYCTRVVPGRKPTGAPTTTPRKVSDRKCRPHFSRTNLITTCRYGYTEGSYCTFACSKGTLANRASRKRTCECTAKACNWSGVGARCVVRNGSTQSNGSIGSSLADRLRAFFSRAFGTG